LDFSKLGFVRKLRPKLIDQIDPSRDNNVNEYLKLSANAERQQQNRIKQVPIV
jgi:hypothetical protein